MRKAAVTLWLLNLFDALATWYAVKRVHPYAREANPVAGMLMDHGPWWFFGVKVGAVTAATLLLVFVRGRRPRLVDWTLGVAVVVYGLLALVHIYGFLIWRHA